MRRDATRNTGGCRCFTCNSNQIHDFVLGFWFSVTARPNSNGRLTPQSHVCVNNLNQQHFASLFLHGCLFMLPRYEFLPLRFLFSETGLYIKLCGRRREDKAVRMLFIPVKQAWEDLHELVQRDRQAGKKEKKEKEIRSAEIVRGERQRRAVGGADAHFGGIRSLV